MFRAAAARLDRGGPRRLALAIGVAGVLAIMALDALVKDETVPRGDDLIYERMADHPFGTHTYVFAYRIAIPWLVHVLPFSHTTSFSVLAWVGSGAAAGVLFLLLEELRISRATAIPLALALAISPPLLVASARQGRNPDPMSVLVMVTGALFIVRRQPRALALTMFVGALNRESALFLGPLAYTVWAQRPIDLPVVRRVLAVGAPAVAAFVALRFTIGTVGRQQIPGYGSSLLQGRRDILREGFDHAGVQARRLALAFGPLWLTLVPAWRGSSFVRRSWPLLVLCAAACTFALDWNRVWFMSAPVFFVAGGWTMDHHRRLRIPVLIALFALAIVYAVYLRSTGLRNIIDIAPPRYVVQ